MTEQFVITQKFSQTEIPILLNRWVTNTPSVKILSRQNIASSYVFVKSKMC